MLLDPARSVPARAHGGIVAAVFDDTMGFVLSMQGTPVPIVPERYDEEVAESMNGFGGGGLPAYVGIRTVDVTPGRMVVALPVRADLLNPSARRPRPRHRPVPPHRTGPVGRRRE